MFARVLSLQHIRPLAYLLAALGAGMFFFATASSAFAVTPTVTAETDDTTADGTIDRIVLTFSEPVDINDGSAGNGFSSIVLNNGCTIANADYFSDSTLTLTLVVTGCTAGNTAITPTVSYTQVANCATAFSICDNDGDDNQLATAAPNTTAVDGADPVALTATAYDATGNDGRLDKIIVIWSENVTAAADAASTMSLGSVSDFSTIVEGTVPCNSGAAAANACNYNFTTATVKTDVGDLYLNIIFDAATDSLNNHSAPTNFDGSAEIVDGAAPVLASSSPAANATRVQKNAAVTLTFSEPVTYASFDYTLTPTAVHTTSPTSGSSKTFTLSGVKRFGANVLTIDAAEDLDGNTLNAANTIYTDNEFTFSVLNSSSDPVVTTPTYSATLTAPNGGEAYAPGDLVNVTWSATSSNNALVAVNLSYSTDGATWTNIVTNTANDGSYTWTVPSVNSSSVWLKVAGTDQVETLATDTSNASFTITADDVTDDDDTSGEAPSSGETGTSPVTGEVEDISEVSYGDYILSPYYSTVYYVDYAANGITLIRRPFMDAQTFMTWQNDFSNVITVTDATLPTLSLGGPMLPKSGVVLVKIQSVAKVYAIENGNVLRWVTSEAAAVDLYGNNWADYIIDIPDTLYPRFTKGADLEVGDSVDTDDMKTRAEVNS